MKSKGSVRFRSGFGHHLVCFYRFPFGTVLFFISTKYEDRYGEPNDQ